MEQAPKTKYEIHFSAEDFGELLKNNRQLINILRETLHINTLQATIMSLLPKPLDLKTLDEIQQDTLRHHWRLFNLNPDFLPKFKEDIMQDVQDAIQKRR
jgi:ABC-type polysaccharide transport system permease subunit